MAQITAAEVSKLRKATGAGMMDCKKALEEAGGDYDKAVEIIRKKGQAIANKRSDREASEGAVLAGVTADNKKGALIVLNCETDFVAKNEDFVELAKSILDVALAKLPADLEALKNEKLGDKTIDEAVVERMGVTGEKLELSAYEKIEAEDAIAYIHPGNKLATVVGFNKKVSDVQVAKDVAMQVAAMNPVSIDKDDVPADVIEKEKEIGREQARQEGKAENLLDRIAEGKLNKFFKESTLLNQDFIKESKQTVKQYLQEADKDLKVTAFKRYSLSD
ncbi:MAG TPA: translation elongation factor Ts [Bacteroidales bacterium]|nr:translation elongation factor Ts [Bacteroidales bacterium]